MSAARVRRTAPRLLGVLLAVSGALAGCTSSSSPVSSSPSGSAPVASSTSDAYPAVLPSQAQRIVDEVDTALDAVATSGDLTPAGGRVIGPARDALAASLTVTRARRLATAPASPVSTTRLLVPDAAPWPRWFVTAGSAPTLPTPVVRLFVSPSPRLPFGLWGQLQLLPGAALPAAAPGAVGVAALTPTTTGLVLTPVAVAALYGDVLTRGAASGAAPSFARDDFRTQVEQRLTADRAAIVTTGFATLSSVHTPIPGALYALRTSDGGALVLAALRQVYVAVVRNGAVTVDADLAALAGRAGRPLFTQRLTRTSVELLAFHVPTTTQGGPIRLVAASRADISATGS